MVCTVAPGTVDVTNLLELLVSLPDAAIVCPDPVIAVGDIF